MVETVRQIDYFLYICSACSHARIERPVPALAYETRYCDQDHDYEIAMIGIPLTGEFSDAQRIVLEKAVSP